MVDYSPPPMLPQEMETIVPHTARRKRYQPLEGHYLTLDLHGEQLRARITGVVTVDSVVVEIEGTPMGKGHSYRKGDLVPCRRALDDFLKVEKWEVVSERELDLAAAAERFTAEEKERANREKKAVLEREAQARLRETPPEERPTEVKNEEPPASPKTSRRRR